MSPLQAGGGRVRCRRRWRPSPVAFELARRGAQIQQAHDEGDGLADAIRVVGRRTRVERLAPMTADFVAHLALGPGAVVAAGILSARETEILPLLKDGLPDEAIARRLAVTEPTVKLPDARPFGGTGERLPEGRYARGPGRSARGRHPAVTDASGCPRSVLGGRRSNGRP